MGLAAVLSIGAHALIAVGFLAFALRDPFGDGVTELETVSVTLVTADDLARPAIAESAPAVAVAAAASDATPAKPDVSDAKPNETDIKEPETKLADAPKAETKEPEAKDAQPSDTKPIDNALIQTPEPERPLDAIVQPKEPPPQQRTPQPPPPAAATAPPVAPAAPTESAAASNATAARYARSVALAVARSRPKGVGQKGRVDIEFSVAAGTGALANARIARSSGSTRLDGLALTAIERASYPRPPNGLDESQLTFRVPFQFD